MGLVFAAVVCASWGATASADPTPSVIEVHLASPVSGRTRITLRSRTWTRSVTVGANATSAELEPLFDGVPAGEDRALISAEAEVPYALVVQVMDALQQHQIVNVALQPAPRRGH